MASSKVLKGYGISLFIMIIILCFDFSAVSAGDDCDKAQYFFLLGRHAEKEKSLSSYMEAIKLCPGFIRPYELTGNLHRKKGDNEKAIEFFTTAAELGSNNYKLYYLLSGLLFEKGDIDEANRHLTKSLSIRGDYPKALDLKKKIDRVLDRDGPKLVLFEPSTHRGLKMVHQYENLTVRGMATDISGISWVRVNQLGAFYVLPYIGELGISPEKFAKYLLDKAKVAVTPGDALGDFTEGTIRISYANSYKILEEAMDRMETAIKTI